MNKVYLFIVYVFGECQQMIHFGLKSKLIQLLLLSNFAYISGSKVTIPNQLAHYCTLADLRDTLSNSIQANL